MIPDIPRIILGICFYAIHCKSVFMSQIKRKFDLLNIVISKIFLKSNHESDNSIEDKNQLMLKKLIKVIFYAKRHSLQA